MRATHTFRLHRSDAVGGRCRRALLGALLAVLAAALCMPGPALAASKKPATLTFTPARPLDSQAITVTWKADRAPRDGYTYRLELVTGDQIECASNSGVDLEPKWKKGARIRVKFRPVTESVWCLYRTRLRLIATRGFGPGRPATVIASAYVPITNNSATPIPDPPGTPTKIDLLEGSSMTIRVPGRPDRTSALTGALAGRMPGRFRPNSDLAIDLRTGTLSVSSLAADPLCTPSGRAYPSPVNMNGTLSSLVLGASGVGVMTLVLAEDPLALTGCLGPAPATSRPIALTGTVGPTGLVTFTMTGSLGGVRLNEGADATIDITLVVKIDLSGR